MNQCHIFDPLKYLATIRFIRNIYAMYSVSYRYNPNTTNPYSACKQPNLNIHNFYLVYKTRNYSFPFKFGFFQIIRIRPNYSDSVHPYSWSWSVGRLIAWSVTRSLGHSHFSRSLFYIAHMVFYGPLWSPMVLCGPLWFPMVLYGPLWSSMVPYGILWSPIWSWTVP